MPYASTIEHTVFRFADLKGLMAKATPERSGDQLAGLAAETSVERIAAQIALADLPLTVLLADELTHPKRIKSCVRFPSTMEIFTGPVRLSVLQTPGAPTQLY